MCIRDRAEIGCPPEIVMRHRPTQFGHIFASDGYSAGYYAYLWADTLVADAAEAFREAGSFYDAAIARPLRRYRRADARARVPDRLSWVKSPHRRLPRHAGRQIGDDAACSSVGCA